jgi:hypothetical protein
MKTLFLLLLAVTLIGAGLLIMIGETAGELWASEATLKAGPSLTVYCEDPNLPKP